ncbi:hypothetical protein LJ656_09605 [Paraburkholderia sp. MMS20-SJTR3]|uniref:Uncharacterized protein n=1 Tax=Paraburkholderia sejongensis TaxID=2886946 RepID=A0ABS8JSG0_9BURK|nr:hypothetical protein [Paraburkholderia sp. MMS20-SJTR3]MCC8392843.1 hypothetical protein [Paraburkholderia sp. MMS20-SJTR3]
MKRTLATMLLSLPALCPAETRPNPPCSNWPTSMAQVELRNAGILGDIDASKTRAVQLASGEIGKYKDGTQLWREVYHVTFQEKNGAEVKVITVSNAGEEECSMSDVEVFVVSRHLPPGDPVIKELDDPARKH